MIYGQILKSRNIRSKEKNENEYAPIHLHFLISQYQILIFLLIHLTL